MRVRLDGGEVAEVRDAVGSTNNDTTASDALDEWILRGKYNEPIANFLFKDVSPLNIYESGEIKAKIRLTMVFAKDTESESFVISQSELEDGNVRWSNHDRRARLHPDCSKGSKV
jgi:hypothetical protein